MTKLLTRAYMRAFLALDRVGVHVLPKHYYTPIPDYTWLRKHPEAWMRRASLAGINWDLDRQLEWLAAICGPYYHEVTEQTGYSEMIATWGNRLGLMSSQVLHCVMRSKAPARIIEIGSGTSTHCMLHALKLNEEEGRGTAKVTCIEPDPSKSLRALPNVHLLAQPCQSVPDSVFRQLQAGDLLFLDSSHAVKVGSDAIRIYLDIIPQLPSGVLVHVHDINLPYPYPRSALESFFGWQEVALLLALLTNNQHLAVHACMSALHYDRPAQVKSILRDYEPQPNSNGLSTSHLARGHFPTSIWLGTN